LNLEWKKKESLIGEADDNELGEAWCVKWGRWFARGWQSESGS